MMSKSSLGLKSEVRNEVVSILSPLEIAIGQGEVMDTFGNGAEHPGIELQIPSSKVPLVTKYTSLVASSISLQMTIGFFS